MTIVRKEVGPIIFAEIENSTIIKIRKRKSCIHLLGKYKTGQVRMKPHREFVGIAGGIRDVL